MTKIITLCEQRYLTLAELEALFRTLQIEWAARVCAPVFSVVLPTRIGLPAGLSYHQLRTDDGHRPLVPADRPLRREA